MAEADIRVLVGVAKGGADGDSAALIQEELNEIMKNIKAEVQLDTTKFRKELTKQLTDATKSSKFELTISNASLDSKAITSLKNQLSSIFSGLNLSNGVGTVNVEGTVNVKGDLDGAAASAEEAAKKAAEFKKQLAELDNQAANIASTFDKLGTNSEFLTEGQTTELQNLTEQYDNWKTAIEAVKEAGDKDSGDRLDALKSEGEIILSNISGINEECEALARETEKNKERNTVLKQAYSLLTQVQNAQRNWTAAQNGTSSAEYEKLGTYASSLNGIISALENGGEVTQQTKAQIKEVSASFAESSNIIKSAGENTQTFGERIGGLASKFSSWLSVSQVIMKVYNALRKMVTAVVDVDTALTELKKVTDESESTYADYLDEAAERAKSLGATISDTVDASADFARLGYTLEEAAELADAALVYKNVGDGIDDISDASESIISTMKAFNIAAEDAMTIVDKFNEVGNNFAITSDDIGEALQRSASSLAAGNNTLDESIALITAANSVVQDASSVGTAMKTISMYLRAAETEAEEAGESTDGMASSVSELRAELLALTGGQVDIQIDEDTFKSTYEILKELSEVWNDLTDVTQANILELIGGKRNSNVVSSLLQNFDVAEEVLETAANSAGSALEENEKYLDSINGKISEFKAAFEELSVTLIDSEFVKNIIELGTSFLEILEKVAELVDAIGGLNTILGVTLGTVMSIKSASIASAILKLGEPIKKVTTLFTSAREAGATFGQSIISVFTQAAAGAVSLESALTAAISVIGAAITVFTIVYTIYEKLHKSTEDLVKASEELKEAFQEIRTETQTNIETLEGLADEFEELAAGVDQYGNNISLSADDYERYQEIVEQIIDISPELISGYDVENGYLVEKNELLERAIELQEQEYQTELKRVTTTSSLASMLEGSVATYNDLIDEDASPANQIWQLFNMDSRNDIPDDMDKSEFFARQIMSALGIDSIDSELEKYIDEYGYLQLGDFWNDYLDTIIADMQSGHSAIIGSIDWSEAGFESKDAFNLISQAAEDAVVAYSEYQDEIEQVNADIAEQLLLVAESNGAYSELSDSARDIISDFINSFTIEDVTSDGFFGGKVIDENAISNAKAQISEFIDKITPEIEELLETGSTLMSGLDENGESLLVGAYEDAIQELIAAIGSIDDENLKTLIEAFFGLDGSSNSFDDEITAAISHVKNLLQDEYDDMVDDMSVSDVLQIYYTISAEPNSMTIAELKSQLIDAAESFDTLSEATSGIISGIEAVQEIMSSQVNGQSISLEDFTAEGMEDYQEALEYVNGTMQLNAEKVREITEAKAEEQIAVNETNKVLAQSEYLSNAKQIETYRKKLAEANYENGETEESIQASIDALLEENSAIAATCKQYDLLSASLQEAVGAYQNWLNAQSASDYGDMADDTVEAIQNIIDTFSSDSDIYGNYGSKKFAAAVEFIIPDSVDQDDIAAINSYMADFLSYLSFDDDGEVEGLNISEFLSRAAEAGLVDFGEDGSWTITGKSLEDFAEGLGLSLGVVQAFIDELQLKGATFDWSDEAVKTYGDLAVEATEAAEALRAIEGNENLNIKLDISDLETTSEQLSALDETIAEMNSIKASAEVDSSEIENANAVIQYCVAQKQLLTQPDVMRVDTAQCEDDIAYVISLLQEFQTAQNTLEVRESIGADISDAEADVEALAEQIQAISPEIKATLGLDTTSVDALQESIYALAADTIVSFGVDASAITGYDPETKTCDVIYNPDTDLLPQSFDPLSVDVIYEPDTSALPESFSTITRKVVYYTTSLGSTADVSGTAHAAGTAKASGGWGTSASQRALVGELGREIVVNPHTGRWYTVGDRGAEFVSIPSGAIVFNHRQTESLLKNGYAPGRASALASGTAMLEGSGDDYGDRSGLIDLSEIDASNVTATVSVEADSEALEEQLKDTLEEMADDMADIINDFEHSIFLMEKNGAGTLEIVAAYRKMQEAVHAQAEEYRALGLSENSDYIQELQEQWWEYQESIQEAIIADYESAVSDHENAITLTENWIDNALSGGNTYAAERYTKDIISHYEDMQKIIHEQAEYYRSLGYSDTSDEVSKLSDLWWDYAEQIDEIKQQIVDSLNEIVDTASDAVDEIQSVYDTLHNAADEYASGGYVTVDTLQEIIDMGIEYLQMLVDENGLLVINEERINAVIAARTEELALESALTYIERIQLALRGESNESLEEILYTTTEATDATWGLVYAELAYMNQIGDLTDEQYSAAVHNIQALQSIANSAISGISSTADATSTALSEMKEGLDDILDYVMDMLKQKIEDQIDALEDMKDAYQEIIDLRKEALEAAKDEADYEEEVADKIQEIADLQARINALSLDDSRSAQAEKAALEEEMYELQKELADLQADYALEAQEDALDSMAEAYSAEKDEEIAVLEDSISSYQKLYDMAIEYIDENWDTLYSELIEWNTEYGTVLNSTITEAWENALLAAQAYGDYVSALESIDSDIDSSEGTTHNDTVTESSSSSYTDEDSIHAIIKEMYANAKAWSTASSSEQTYLSNRNLTLGAMLAQYGITAVRGSDGVWYVDKVGGEELFDKYSDYIYHTGGVAGDSPTLKQNEILATLEKGEAILDSREQDSLYRIIEFTTTLSDKLSELLSTGGASELLTNTGAGLPSASAELAAVGSQSNNVTFGNVIIYGANDETAEKHREINREFTNEILKQLNIRK